MTDDFVIQYFSHRILTVFAYSSFVVLIYDYLLTISQEINYIWTASWSLGKGFYLITRYLVFVDTSLVVMTTVFVPKALTTCHVSFSVIGWLEALGILIADAILVLRTWAIWDKKKSILYICLACFFALCIACLFCVQKFLLSLKFRPLQQPPICSVQSASPILFGSYLAILFFETVVLILTVLKGYLYYREGRSNPFPSLFRDGFLYYVYLFGFSATNVVVLTLLSADYANVMTTLHRVMHAVLSGRMLLKMRTDFAQRDISRSTGTELSTFAMQYDVTRARSELELTSEPVLDETAADMKA